MSLTAKNEGKDFELVPTGPKMARCYKVIDLGTTFNEKYQKKQHQVLISWEFPECLMEDGRPFSVSNWYTVSLHEKSNLRKDLESWRGRVFTETELQGFELGNVLDKSCYINVIHNETPKKTYANVSSIMPLPDGMECPKAVNPLVVFNLSEFDQTVFDELPEGIQDIIKKSEEYQMIGVVSEEEQPPLRSCYDYPQRRDQSRDDRGDTCP